MMKHISWRILPLALIVFLYSFCALFSVSAQAYSGDIAASFASGSGTQNDPYVIKNADQLESLAKQTNSGNPFSGKYFILENDVALNDESFVFDCDTGLVKVSDGKNTAYLGTGIKGDGSKNNTVFDSIASEIGVWYASDTSKTKGSYGGTLNNWTPIGNEGARFEGIFDGKGHTISGMYINTPLDYGGLFGYSNAILENVKIGNSYIRSGEYTGSIAGQNSNLTKGCVADAIVCSDNSYVGGVVGSGSLVTDCFSGCTVSAAQFVGGIAGKAKVERCCNSGNVFGDTYVGGVLGEGRGSDNVNTANVIGTEGVGGVCGVLGKNMSNPTISTSYNTGVVNGEKYVGAIVGRLVKGSAQSCYYLKGTAQDLSGKVQNGLGAAASGSSRSDPSGATTGLDELQIKQKESFEGFDFENVWIISSSGAPMLASLNAELHTHTYDNACDEDCNVCGVKRVVEHSYNSEWSANAYAHWYECSVCSQKKNYENHTSGVPATETSPQRCTVCSYVIVPAQGHTHKFSNAWSKDSSGHWYACACGEKQSISSHRYDNSCDTVCNDCSYTRLISHNYKIGWVSDNSAHWHECSECPQKTDYESHKPGAPATESSPQLCTVCLYVITPAQGHTHKFSNAWSKDSSGHWYACACGEKQSFSSHRYDNSCDTVCNDCAWVRTTTHSYKIEMSKDEASHWYECSVCFAKKDIEAHGFDNSCDASCNVCGYTRAVSHSYKNEWSTDKSSHWRECSVCSDKTDVENHIPGDDANENTPQVCTVCYYVITPALGHTHKYSNEWSADSVNHWHFCPCGDKGDLAKHKYDNNCDTSCNECGYERSISHSFKTKWSKDEFSHWYECSVCGLKKDEAAHEYDNACDKSCNDCSYVRAITHSYQTQWTSNRNSHWHECPVCSEKTDTEEHKYDNSCDAICNVCGYERGITHSYNTERSYDSNNHWYECSVCSHQKNVGAHKYDNACDMSCNTCSYERSITHSYKSEWSTDKSSHWYECSVCADKKDMASHTPGAPATEASPQRCTVCSYVIAPQVGHVHSYADVLSKDGTNHWYECACGDKSNIEKHKYDNSCDKSCSVCGYERTVKHTYGDVKKYDDRSHWLECSVCFEKKQTEIHVFDNLCDITCNECEYSRKITHVYDGSWSANENQHWQKCVLCNADSEKAPHTWNSGTVSKEPTKSEEGIKTYKCLECAYTKNEPIDKLAVDTTTAVTTTDTPVTTTDASTSAADGSTQPSTTTASPETTPSTGYQTNDSHGDDGHFVLAIALGITSVVLLVALIVMLMYVWKKKGK